MGEWDYLDELPYRKKAQKETPRKIGHRHDYETVLVYNPKSGTHLDYTGKKFRYRLAQRCVICGRILPGGKQYAKEGDWYFEITYGKEPIYRLDDKYDLYVIDEPISYPSKNAKYSLVKRKRSSI